MPRPCAICTHPDRSTIEAAMATGDSYREIASRFELSKSAVARHAANHLQHEGQLPAPATTTGAVQSVPTNPVRTRRTYNCCYPSFRIGTKVAFENGRFTTTVPELQRLVEINPWFGRYITREDDPPPADGAVRTPYA